MSTQPSIRRRLGTVSRWPVGMALTSWRYLWRTTALHRVDEEGSADDVAEPDPTAGGSDRLQPASEGVGALFHRRYQIRIDNAGTSAAELMGLLACRPDRPAPREVAVFWKTRGAEGELRVGDEFLVRMPGPWDGPVRVVDRTPTSFRLATLRGHLEAGQIEFRAHDDDGALRFEIESWTRSGDRLSDLLYSRLRLIKEMQLHMWAHYCEHVPKVSGGRPVGGLRIHTTRVTDPPTA